MTDVDYNYNYDLSKGIKNKTISLKKNKTSAINLSNDVAGQVTLSESGNNIILTVYKTQKTTYSYTKVVEEYNKIGETSKYKVTTTKYVYAKVPNDENNSWAWQVSGKSTNREVNATEVPSQITGEKKYWVAYSMQSSGNSSFHTSSYYATTSATAKDETYQNIIYRYGTEVKTVSDKVMATITVKNADKATELTLRTDRNMGNDPAAPVDLKNTYYSAVHKDDKFTGTFLNEIATSSDADETFTLKTGNDIINYAFFDGFSKMGNDIVNVAKGEDLTLNMLNSTKNTTAKADVNADMFVNTAFSKKGNDVILKYTDENGASLGQTTVKNYFKIAQDNVTLAYSGASSSVVDKEYSLRDLLAYEDGIGYLGDESSKKAQNITGNFVDNTITTGSGKDTIKCVAGDNQVNAGQNDDIIYSGTGRDSFLIYEGDATGSKGDKIYNADKDDSIYFLVQSGDVYVEGPTYFAETTDPAHAPTFEFTKNGNSLVVNYNKVNVQNPELKKEKVTFVDYFKKNSELFNINDAGDYSKVTINQTAKGTVKGTNYGDDITLTGKSNVYTGNGNDTVKFYYQTGDTEHGYTTHVVDKNVNVYIDGTGNKTFSKSVGDEKGKGQEVGDMGNKTLIFNVAGTGDSVNMNLGVKVQDGEGYIYTKKGNDLVIEGYYGMQGSYDPQNANYDSYGSYTVKNYFKNFGYEGTLKVDNTAMNLAGLDFLYQQGKKNKAATFYDTKYNDYILGANKNDKYYFTNGGKDRVYDVKGNDTYNVEVNSNASEVKIFDSGKGNDKYNFTKSDLSTTVYINDDGGKRDSLVITSLNPESKISVGVLFNVLNKDYSGPVVDSKFLKDDALFLYNKANNLKTSGHIEIGNYFAKDSEGTYSKGAGVIETMKLDGVNIDVSHLDAIRSQVATFLSTATTSYASAYQCLMGNNETDIANLISAYTYNQTT